MLDAASKTLLKYKGPGLANRQKIRDMDNLEMIDLGTDGDLAQVDTFPRNMQLFDGSKEKWQIHGQQMSAATDALLGEAPSSGTPFKLQDLITQQGQGIHDYRKGKLATFWDEVEMDWIMPYLAKEITQAQEFLAELDLEELQYVGEALVQCEQEKMKKQYVLANFGQAATPEMVQGYNDLVLEQFKKKGNKHFISILKGEMKDVPLTVRTNVAGKQKDLSGKVDKLTNLIRFIFTTYNPQTQTFAAFDDPRVAKLLNITIEASGLDPVDFSGKGKAPTQPAQQNIPKPVQKVEPAY